MDASVSDAAGRTRIAWRCAGGLVLFAFFMQLVSGRSFWGSVFTAPLVALLMLYATLPVSLAWFAAIGTTVWGIGAVTGSWPDTLRKTTLAIAIGLTPHVLFLIDVNMYRGSFSRTAADLERSTALARWYESMVVHLQDTAGDYLMPALLAGTALSVTMFLVGRWLGSARFDRGWELVKDGTRFAGIVLAAAATFTGLTAAPSGNWQPDPRQLVKARIAALVKSKVREALYMAVRDELRAPESALRDSVRQVSNEAGADPGEPHAIAAEMSRSYVEQKVDSQAVAEAMRVARHARMRALAKEQSVGEAVDAIEVPLSRPEAREQADILHTRAAAVDQQTQTIAREVAGICASVAGTATEAFGGKLLAALVEDAAGRITTDILLASSGARDALEWASGRALPFIDLIVRQSYTLALARLRALMADQRNLRTAQETVRERAMREAVRARIEEYRERSRARGAGR